MRKISLVCICMLFIAGLMACQPGAGTRTVTLYFQDKESGLLAGEKREIPNQDFEKQTVLELIKGPASPGLTATLPEQTRLLHLKMEGKVAVLDFSSDIRDRHWGGSGGEAATVYSLANTMAALPTVERIRILIEGQEVDSLLGHLSIQGEIEKNDKMEKKD